PTSPARRRARRRQRGRRSRTITTARAVRSDPRRRSTRAGTRSGTVVREDGVAAVERGDVGQVVGRGPERGAAERAPTDAGDDGVELDDEPVDLAAERAREDAAAREVDVERGVLGLERSYD